MEEWAYRLRLKDNSTMVAAAKFGPESYPGNEVLAQRSEDPPAGGMGKQMDILLCRFHRKQRGTTRKWSSNTFQFMFPGHLTGGAG